MKTTKDAARRAQLVRELTGMKIHKDKLVKMAEAGQLYEIACEMPTCYCPEGRRRFADRSTPMEPWALNADHYPNLKKDGGKLEPGNIRLAHVMCNRQDYSWRTRIRAMLNDGLSLEEIADRLNNAKKRVPSPHGTGSWTARTVRKAYVS